MNDRPLHDGEPRTADRSGTASEPAGDVRAAAGSHPAAAPRQASTPREVELKYLVRDLKALRDWLERDWGGALDGVDSGELRSVQVEDRYVDTAYGALEQAGFGARLRREDGGPVTVTVKSISHDRPEGEAAPSELAALSHRVEVEGPADDRLEPDAWPPSSARELVNALRRGSRLRTLFTIDQRRERRTLALDDGPVEVTLDRVIVVRGARPLSSFAVLEVEAGDRRGADLGRLAALVEATGFVSPEPRSKEEIARRYVAAAAEDRTHRLPRVPAAPGVTADDPLAEAGRKVLRMHLARMLLFEAGARSGDDPEDVHKMRVATRRMRAAWRVFEGAYRPRLRRRYERELRDVAKALGDVRDADVLLEDLESYLARLPASGRQAMEPLRSAWRRDREAARGRLVARLETKAYREFVEDYLDFTESPGAGAVAVPPGRPSLVRDTAGSRILAAYEHVRAYETVIGWADADMLHALRISGKRLRYTLESFAEVLPPTSRALLETVTRMQDHLGLMNDAAVAAARAREWLNTNAPLLPATTREAVGIYMEARDAEAAKLRRTFRPLWRRVTGAAFRRSLGLAVTRIE